MDAPDFYGRTRRRNPLVVAVLVALAFALGIGLTLLAAKRLEAIGRWIAPPAAAPAEPPVAIISARPPPVIVQPAPAADPALSRRVGQVEAQLAEVESRAEAATGNADRAEGLLIAFAARRALDRGQPLGYLEGLLRERFGDRDAASVAQVIAASQRPVTVVALRERLEALRPVLVANAPGEGLWAGVRREVSSLFVLRRAGEPSQAAPDRFARALSALDDGLVDVAATEVARMPGAPGAGDWLALARRYVLARNALDRLETAALLAPRTRPAAPEAL